MRLRDFLIFLACFSFFSGFFIFIKMIISKFLYDLNKDDFDTFQDFMIKLENISKNKFIRKLKSRKYSSLKKYTIISSLKFVFLVLFALCLLVLILGIENSDYKLYLYYKM